LTRGVWLLDAKWAGIALPFGLVLWVLFFFDHTVSVRKFSYDSHPIPHLDRGCSLSWHIVAGLLGLPAPNGLIPRAPIHTASLVVWGRHANNKRDEEDGVDVEKSREGDGGCDSREVPTSVVERRVSNLAQGALCLVLLTNPFLHVLSLVPRGTLAGLSYVDSFGSD